MASYILIAGAWHGSWCWSEVVPLLTAAGHRVLTPDLMGQADGTASTLENPVAAWADQIAAIVQSESEPVILVGHSRGGLVISEVAERVPEKIGTLIYVAAFLLQSGETLNDRLQQTDNVSAMGEGMIFHENGTLTLTSAVVKRYFYSETTETLAQMACERLVPEPIATSVTPVHVTAERFGTVPRAYIECTRDRGLTPNVQRAMREAQPVAFVDQLDADHSPFFSRPAELVQSLERARQAIMPGRRDTPESCNS